MPNQKLTQQNGGILILVALTLPVLLGFGGLVIDLGGLFVAKTELQSALDSCALAAANELDGAADALTRATNAGLTAGNINKVKYQGSSAGIVSADITYSNTLAGSYNAPAATARYAQCKHTIKDITAYLIQSLPGASALSKNDVGALAIATRVHAQSSCPVPIGLRERTNTPPNYGYQVGEWITMLYDPTKSDPSEMGWYNLDGSNSASETKNEMAGTGYCGSKLGDTIGTPGAKVSVDDEWNARFGIYKNNGDPASSTMRPDFTGYAYCQTATNPDCKKTNWAVRVPAGPQNAYSGTTPAGSDPTAANFVTMRQSPRYASYGNTSTDPKDGDKITGLNMKGGYKDLASPGVGGQHQLLGKNQRIVLTPIVDGSSKIADYACMLMLQPISGPTTSVQLEYIGNAGAINSPCTSNGLAGGVAGPLVPTLVR